MNTTARIIRLETRRKAGVIVIDRYEDGEHEEDDHKRALEAGARVIVLEDEHGEH